MKSTRDWLEFLVEFSQLKLAVLSRGQWVDLTEKVLRFTHLPRERRKEITLGILEEVQDRLYPVLQLFADAASEGRNAQRGVYFPMSSTTVIAFRPTRFNPQVLESYLTEDASLEDHFYLATIRALPRSAAENLIRQCRAEDCRRLFVASHGAQVFHRPLCERKVTMRRWRARQKQRLLARKTRRAARAQAGGPARADAAGGQQSSPATAA